MNATQIRALQTIVLGVLEAVKAGGEAGGSGGVLYAAMMAQGASFTQFQSIMSSMMNSALLKLDDSDHYHITAIGEERMVSLRLILAA